MTPYSSLHVSSPQGMVLRTQAQPVSPLVASFPTLQDDAAFPLGLKKSGSEPTQAALTLSSPNVLLSALWAIRLVKEEAEEPLGLAFFSSGHSR